MRGFAAICLHNAKTPENVGGVIRAAQCYGAALVVLSGKRQAFEKRINLGRCVTDTMKGFKSIPLLRLDEPVDGIPFDCVPVGVELVDGATSLVSYTHPERAYYIFGPEDGSLGKEILTSCRDIVQVPTRFCMNLAACVNVVLYDRMAKREGRKDA